MQGVKRSSDEGELRQILVIILYTIMSTFQISFGDDNRNKKCSQTAYPNKLCPIDEKRNR